MKNVIQGANPFNLRGLVSRTFRLLPGRRFAPDARWQMVCILVGVLSLLSPGAQAQSVTATVAAGVTPRAVAVNPVTNKIYVANSNSNNVTVIDGATNSTATVAAGGFPFAVAVNPVTNKIYVANVNSNNVTVITPSTDTTLPLTTAVTSTAFIPGLANATSNTTPSFTLTASSTYTPGTPAIRTVYYRLNSGTGEWTQASGSGPFTATLPALAKGEHVLLAYAVDSLEGGAAGGSAASGSGSSPIVGSVVAFPFSVIDPLAQTITFAATPATVLTPAPAFTVSATGGASGNPVTFSSLTPTICTSSGINGVTITLAAMATGNCTIRANQAGNANYLVAAAVDRSIAVSFLPPPPPPSIPQNLQCLVTGVGAIHCQFNASTSSQANPIQSYRLYCLNEAGAGVSTAAQTTVAANTQTTTFSASLDKLAAGRYRCTVTAQGTTSASDVSAASLVAISNISIALRNQIDMDGQGFAQILLRGTGASADAGAADKLSTKAGLMTQLGRYDIATQKFIFTAITDVGADKSLLGAGDLVGIGRTQIVTRNISEQVFAEFAANMTSSTLLRRAQSDWVVEAVTDLDGDGKADIVWRYMKPGTNDSGVIFAWYSAGRDAATLNVGEVKHRGGAPLGWSLIGAADLDGDGKADILWQSPTNELRSLTAKDNRTWVNERIGPLPTGYSIVKLGDFNADGKADIVFKDAAGRVKIWLMNGITITLDTMLPRVEATTQFYAAGDFNGDGTMDMVWKKADGSLTLWLMNGVIINQPTIIDNVGFAPAGGVVVE